MDISENKVGKNISEAIKVSELGVMVDFHKDFNVLVVMGDIFDGVISETEKNIKPAK